MARKNEELAEDQLLGKTTFYHQKYEQYRLNRSRWFEYSHKQCLTMGDIFFHYV